MTPRFAIYYADGSVVEGGGPTDETVAVTLRVSRDWLRAKSTGVLAVICEDPYTSRVVQRGADHYFPLEHGQYGFADDLKPWLFGKLEGVIKLGEYVSSETMAAMWRWAKSYVRIPRDGDRKPHPWQE